MTSVHFEFIQSGGTLAIMVTLSLMLRTDFVLQIKRINDDDDDYNKARQFQFIKYWKIYFSTYDGFNSTLKCYIYFIMSIKTNKTFDIWYHFHQN